MRRVIIATALAAGLFASTFRADSAYAGSGYYDYGIQVGYYQFLEDAGPFADRDGGVMLGFKRGLYFIKDALALGIDYLGFNVALLGENYDEWVVELPAPGLNVGVGFDTFMFYLGGSLGLVGMDRLDDELRVSLLNPRAVGGLQVGFLENWVLRGEFQYGYQIRLGDVPNYNFYNVALTFGYGFYSSFL
ncbi:MAG: hypothetical protein KC561_19070 [Myxococcales bacterium]|nr:hypothetical protein [Myxococcales bacterium]